MTKREYDWVSVEDPPIIKDHTLDTHKVLVKYLERYLGKLYGGARDYVRFSIVDGFAGGGIYRRSDNQEFHFGSPIQLMEVVNRARTGLPAMYSKMVQLRPRYYFIEQNQTNLEVLKQTLENLELDPVVDGLGGCVLGEFTEKLPQVVKDIKSEGLRHRVLFVLDCFDYVDVPAAAMQSIFSELPQAEIIFTFSVNDLLDYISGKPQLFERCQQRLNQLGVACSVEDLVSMKESTPQARLLVQDLLSEDLSSSCGAKFFTRFFIHSNEHQIENGSSSIWLVHMSQHQVARDEMVKVHWESVSQLSTHSGFQGVDDHGIKELGYKPEFETRLGEINLEYGFDPASEKASVEILLKQLPDLIWRKHAMTLSELMGLIANFTPVSSDIVKKVLNILLKAKDIEIVSREGVKRNKGSAVHWFDMIKAKRKDMFGYV